MVSGPSRRERRTLEKRRRLFSTCGRALGFSADRLPDEAGYKLYLVAKWGMNYKLTIDVGEEARKAGVENIVNQSFTEAGPISQPGLNPEWNGYTFHYYYTEDGKRLRTSEDWAQLVLNDETPELTIYVRWLTGKWYIVTSADGLSDMGQRNYILDADIDMSGREFKTPTNYQARSTETDTRSPISKLLSDRAVSYRRSDCFPLRAEAA